MTDSFHFRALEHGESATHFYHVRLGSIFSAEALRESPWKHDCVLGVLPVSDRVTVSLTANQADLILGALENMPDAMFAFQDREDRELLLREIGRQAESLGIVGAYSDEEADAAAGHP